MFISFIWTLFPLHSEDCIPAYFSQQDAECDNTAVAASVLLPWILVLQVWGKSRCRSQL